ncbi:hypothetical protein K2173_008297 [Erythroxylum novogranatense]|uniref:Uncharacterized protein n=1 Tax=Erythroxylum novogranatense TaxID=1862640 RepID=A0AAV8U6V1_9ROSI|nr:hypothetical protein K2173_008297 [Erythroxylum novogranatense]
MLEIWVFKELYDPEYVTSMFLKSSLCNVGVISVSLLMLFATLRMTLITGEFSKISRLVVEVAQAAKWKFLCGQPPFQYMLWLMKSENRADYSISICLLRCQD